MLLDVALWSCGHPMEAQELVHTVLASSAGKWALKFEQGNKPAIHYVFHVVDQINYTEGSCRRKKFTLYSSKLLCDSRFLKAGLHLGHACQIV